MDKLLGSLEKIIDDATTYVLKPLAVTSLHAAVLVLVVSDEFKSDLSVKASRISFIPPPSVQEALEFYGIKTLLPWIVAIIFLLGINGWYRLSNVVGKSLPPYLSFFGNALYTNLLGTGDV